MKKQYSLFIHSAFFDILLQQKVRQVGLSETRMHCWFYHILFVTEPSFQVCDYVQDRWTFIAFKQLRNNQLRHNNTDLKVKIIRNIYLRWQIILLTNLKFLILPFRMRNGDLCPECPTMRLKNKGENHTIIHLKLTPWAIQVNYLLKARPLT